MLIDWTLEFSDWLDRLEGKADADPIAARRLVYVTAQLQLLQELEQPPEHEGAVLKRVRQSRQYPVWRVSHPFDQDIAVRLIVWFPDDEHAVIAVFAGDKARIGDAFYNSVGSRADAAINQWTREVGR